MNINLFDLNLEMDEEKIIRTHKYQKQLKRVFDIVASFILLIIASPFILVSCIAIRLESKGSPIFKQERYGYKGENFTAYKLRTMYSHSSDGNLSAPKEGDARVTKVGYVLRKTSIDELPQLINVLKGEMSILGPRAVPRRELDLRIDKMLTNHPDKSDFFQKAMRVRMLAKPGISGMAQAFGRSSLTVEQATAYDVYYVLNYSLALDLRIFVETISTVLFRKGVN